VPGDVLPAGGREPAPGRRDLRAGLLIGLLCLLVYNANLRQIGAGDTLPARYLPFGIWRYGSVLLDPIRELTRDGHADHYWIQPGRAGHWLSLYPVVLPVLVAPLYAPAVGYLQLRGWTEQRLMRVAKVMEKLTASLVAAAAAALLYLLLRRRAPRGDALLLTLAFAFGTDTWMIGSQALWQHGMAELLLIGLMLLLTGPCTPGRALAAGVLCGLIAGNRPPDALLAAALGLYGLRWAGRRAAPWLAAGVAVPLGLVVSYNLAAAGNLFGAYGIPHHGGFFRFGLLTGVAGLLLSPARGLLVFSPFLLLAPTAFWQGLRDRGARALTLAAGVGALALVLLYAKADWRAGDSFGPRWLTDLLPLLVWMLPPALATLRGASRLAFVLAVCVATAIQAVGAFWYTGASDAAVLATRRGSPGEMLPAWVPGNAQFIGELRHDRAPFDPAFIPWGDAYGAVGSIDLLSAGGRPVAAAVTSGTPLSVEGWALVEGHSPAAVEVTLDGRTAGATTKFFTRPDVIASRHETGAAGWRIALATGGIRPGTHVLAAAARGKDAAARAVPVAQRQLTVIAPLATPAANGGLGSLDGAARQAAALVGSHQQPAGFWLTAYTAVPRFDRPRQEMNTFLTAMMVDLLDPVAAAAGAGDPTAASLARARAHLGAQIEASGLVRYHGRPDGPTIPALGCAITPDADDTALAWRLAGGGRRALLAQALAILARYRTRDGLYRTWLAPRERYQCIDPGKDPNPTDVGIQMHVLLLLAQADPPAARALCGALGALGALGQALGDDRLWVYYRAAPLVPLLRQADLREAGCPLRLPEARLRTTVAGQEIWLAAGRLLERLRSPDGPLPAPAETLAVLGSLAEDGFSRVRRTPPLLYHNDFSASTPRFYWSEDFGYALWLRLFWENAHRHGGRTASS
jgi:hypothetical protein